MSAAVVPEPTSVAIWSLIGIGLAGLGVWRNRRKK
ncbi:MAG: PEP-CTERM sorting domain-containing protein [Planctomycetales bacterium]|nr:PEP-CTERM sorting domain-containing protein [Planctomycetales bacterium]